MPVAVDNVDHPNQTAAELEFLNSLAERGVKTCTEGYCAFSPGGKLLGWGSGFSAAGAKEMLAQALERFKPDAATVGKGEEGVRRPPEGGLVMNVTWSVLSGLSESDASPYGEYAPYFRRALGSDRLWVRRDEAEALAKGELLESLKARIVRRHVRHIFFKAEEIQLALRDGRLSGSFETGAPPRRGWIRGAVEVRDGRVQRFDLVVKGWGDRIEDEGGFAAGMTTIPEGKTVPVAMLFTLADPKDGLSRVLPSALGAEDYIR